MMLLLAVFTLATASVTQQQMGNSRESVSVVAAVCHGVCRAYNSSSSAAQQQQSSCALPMLDKACLQSVVMSTAA